MTTLRAATRKLFERLHDPSVDLDAEFVVAPTSMGEAAEVLTVAAGADIPVSFHGGGTHGRIGNPVSADLVITTSAMNRILDYEPDDLTVRVEPGVTLAQLESTLSDRNLTAVLPESSPESTVGGVISSARSGYRRLRYGPTRDRVLQLTAATGYGKVITGGSPVVKASTGYGMPRLYTGSLGSLGLIGPVLLKLWAHPMAAATVTVDDPEEARMSLYRPLAALGTRDSGEVYLGGIPEEVDAQAETLGGDRRNGLVWPPVGGSHRISFRVPVRSVGDALAHTRDLGADDWVAQHGVGVVEAGLGRIDPVQFTAARAWAESIGGTLVVEEAPDDLRAEVGAWGSPPESVALQREIKQRFDPAGICNPGILPGGL